MKISQLQTFVAIVEKGSFSAGARAQKVSQPAATFQIQALEDSLGVKLIDRSSKALLLTEAGRLCYESAKKIIDQMDILESRLGDLADTVMGDVAIGASTIPGEFILPLAIADFKSMFPETRPRLQVMDTESIVNEVIDGQVDVGVVGAKVDNKKLEFLPFIKDELIVIAHPSYDLDKQKLKISELITDPFILREEGSGTRLVFERVLEPLGLTVRDINVALELGSAEAVITAVQAGLGLSVVSKWAAANALALGKVQELKVDNFPIVRSLFIVTLKGRIKKLVVERFVQFLSSFQMK